MEKEFQRRFVSVRRAWGISAVGVAWSAAPLNKGIAVGLRRGRKDWRLLSAAKCDWLEGAQEGPLYARLLMALQSVDQANPPYTSAIRDLAGGGSVNVLLMRDLADTLEMDLGGSLVVMIAASRW